MTHSRSRRSPVTVKRIFESGGLLDGCIEPLIGELVRGTAVEVLSLLP
jgi:hypothetical protein